jgi:hypothetical protein
LKKVAPLSIFANVNILFGIGVAYTVSVITLVRQHDAGTVFENVTVWANWQYVRGDTLFVVVRVLMTY